MSPNRWKWHCDILRLHFLVVFNRKLEKFRLTYSIIETAPQKLRADWFGWETHLKKGPTYPSSSYTMLLVVQAIYTMHPSFVNLPSESRKDCLQLKMKDSRILLGLSSYVHLFDLCMLRAVNKKWMGGPKLAIAYYTLYSLDFCLGGKSYNSEIWRKNVFSTSGCFRRIKSICESRERDFHCWKLEGDF